MSRRRGQVRGTRSAGHPPWEGKISYYCSGRGSHTPVGHLDRVTSQGGCLRCPLCGVTKPLGYKTRKLIAAAGLTEVDISALPF